MNEIAIIKQIQEFGFVNVIMSIFVVSALVILIITGGQKLIDTLGLETKASLRDKNIDKRLTTLEQKICDFEANQEKYHSQSIAIRDKLKSNQSDLKDDIKELKNLLINKEIDDMRWEMLDFANAAMYGRKYNKEQYDHVLDIYAKYERILEENGMENGRVTSSMEFVQDKYKDLMACGFKQ